MRIPILAALLISYSAWGADLRLDPGTSVEDGTLIVQPRVFGPAGHALRYEIFTTREGGGGTSSSSQSGNVRIGADGTAMLLSSRISVSKEDRYSVRVKLVEGDRVVADEEVRYPD
jgi:hypothetical protein